MATAALETVLRRDRIVVAAALVGLAALAWAYVLWLAADMDMGGMDMSDFRMIPAGMGIMAPALSPWSGMEFGFVFAMWVVMMVGMMTPSAAPMILIYARLGRQTAVADKPFAATGLVCRRVSSGLDRFRAGRDARPVGARPRSFARFEDDKREQRARRRRADCSRHISMDAA